MASSTTYQDLESPAGICRAFLCRSDEIRYSRKLVVNADLLLCDQRSIAIGPQIEGRLRRIYLERVAQTPHVTVSWAPALSFGRHGLAIL